MALVGLLAAAPVSASVPTPRPAEAPRGTNLLLNSSAEAGNASAEGYDAVTIPGWQVLSGLPTVVNYGEPGFASSHDPGPPRRGRKLFVGGAGGTAELLQVIPVRLAGGRSVTSQVRYAISAWLGGSRRCKASVVVTFLSAGNATLGSRKIGPVGGPGTSPSSGLSLARAGGRLPSHTAEVEVELLLWTSVTDYDGPDAPFVGYNLASADDVSFGISARAVRPGPLEPPPAHVPRFQHVFLYYFENEDFREVIGNTVQAPYLNSLLPKASVLASFYAEEHPSDGNYLAFAGGSTFGIPLTDPLEENPHYTIDARNIGDLLDAAHESWKGYLQSANGPCDDTVHGLYWDDDLPFFYFRDVLDRPAYCASHLVPLVQLKQDLAKASTTPSFSWISPNDCSDMEACNITAGDTFLERTLRPILASPAWRTERSLVIITFDEDNYGYERPAQLVPTVVLGSADVREGYTSLVRYTHYSLLRTVEATLGLGTLTDNDRYAEPLNDIFVPKPPPAGGP